MSVGGGLSCGDLGLDLGLDFGERDGAEVVVVYSYVVLAREKHPQARVVYTGLAGGTAMDVAEELPDVAVGAAVAEERVVVQHNSLPANADDHLLCDLLESAHIALADGLYVVVAQDEVLAAGEGV